MRQTSGFKNTTAFMITQQPSKPSSLGREKATLKVGTSTCLLVVGDLMEIQNGSMFFRDYACDF